MTNETQITNAEQWVQRLLQNNYDNDLRFWAPRWVLMSLHKKVIMAVITTC